MNHIEKHLEDIHSELSPDSFRYQVLQSAANFKVGWTDLADKLTEVLRGNLFKEWGYDTFEQYCRLEIRITKKTALKLTGAWNFLQEEAHEFLSGASQESLPDFKAVEMLQKAKSHEDINPEVYDEFKLNVLKNSSDGKEISRQFREFNKLLGNVTAQSDQKIAETLTSKLRKKLIHLTAPDHLLEYLNEIEAYLGKYPEKTDEDN